jgi:type IV secretion system protein VirB6
LGPLFLALLFFETTKRFFESWIAQLANYAFVTILTVLVAELMMTLISAAATQAAGAGGGIQIAQAVRVCMAAGLTFLIMRQVMPMAAGLASGLALSTFGTLSTVIAWSLGRATRSSDQLRRQSGRALAGGATQLARLPSRWRENVIRPQRGG